jgi:hypothetical protein
LSFTQLDADTEQLALKLNGDQGAIVSKRQREDGWGIASK